MESSIAIKENNKLSQNKDLSSGYIIVLRNIGHWHLVGQVVFKFQIKTVKILFLSHNSRIAWPTLILMLFCSSLDIVGATLKPKCQLTNSSLQFWTIYIVLHTNNRLESGETMDQLAVGFKVTPYYTCKMHLLSKKNVDNFKIGNIFG